MAIQQRRGNYTDFKPNKMVPAEIAVVQSGDPVGSNGQAVYVAFQAGTVKRLATHEDIQAEITSATSEIAEELASEIESAVADDVTAAQTAATNASNSATTATEQAQTATQAVSTIGNQISSAFVEKTASGGIVTFQDGADTVPMKSVIAYIEPVQSGSGDPSPSNVRQISGYTGINITRTGKNLLPKRTYDNGSGTGVTYTTIDGGNGVHVSGTATSVININYALFTLPAGRYKVVGYPINDRTIYLRIGLNTIGGTAIKFAYYDDNEFVLDKTTKIGVRVCVANGATVNHDVYPMIIQASETDTTFEPYSGTTYPITFPQSAGTVYGGYVDVTNGKLVVTDANIASYAGQVLPSSWISDRDVYTSGSTPTTGAQVVYKLATPIEYDLTPTEITSLLGYNTVWSDTGDTDVVYKADVGMTVDSEVSAINEILGDILVNNTFNVVGWQQGTINANTGGDSISSTRIRSGFIKLNSRVLEVSAVNGWKMVVRFYSDNSGTYAFGSSDWQESISLSDLNPNYYFRLVIATNNNDTITPSDAPEIKYSTITITDSTLLIENKAADAKKVGDEIAKLAPAIVNTASGGVAHFADGVDALPMKSVIAYIEPVQSGEGDPSPSNVRTISGWTGVKVTRTGRNLFDPSVLFIDRTASGLTSQIMPDGSIHITGKATAAVRYGTSSRLCVLPAGTYIVTGTPQTINARDSSGVISSNGVFTSDGITPIYFALSVTNGETYDIYQKIQLEVGNIEHDWEPCVSSEYNVEFPQSAGTVYGGYVDVTNGKLVVTQKALDLGTLTYTLGSRYSANMPSDSVPTSSSADTMAICEVYARNTATAVSNQPDMTFAVNWSNFSNTKKVAIKDSSADNETTLKTNLNGKKLIYTLATPITYDLTPTEITSLLGYNAVWSDTGNTDVEYKADTKLYIDSLTAPDDDMVADANIPSGKYFTVNNRLYLSTSAIAIGETIVPGSNCTATNLAEALNNLNA